MAASTRSCMTGVIEELGLKTIWNSPFDIKILCLQRFVRMFAYGASTLVLVPYLSALGHSSSQIGLFMTLTLWGDVIISFFLTLFADGLGRRRVLGLGALMMFAAGAVFGVCSNFWLLLAAAILGVISPSGNEIGPFRALEESMIAHLTSKGVRSDVFAWYMVIGTAGVSCGLLVCGWTVGVLREKLDWDEVNAYRVVFAAYAVIGLLKFVLSVVLSGRVEAEPGTKAGDGNEETSLLGREHIIIKKKIGVLERLVPHISKESRGILVQVGFLFALDSFASGMVSMSWITYFFKEKFDIPEGLLGTLFFTASCIAAVSSLGAASLARRIGNIKTMVFTHLPSAILLSLIPLPSQLWLSATFLILRASIASMDDAPRSAFLAAIMLPNERTAVMGVVNVIKTFSQSMGPLLAGVLFGLDRPWILFVIAGTLKATYDLGLLAIFHGHVAREDRAEQVTTAQIEDR